MAKNKQSEGFTVGTLLGQQPDTIKSLSDRLSNLVTDKLEEYRAVSQALIVLAEELEPVLYVIEKNDPGLAIAIETFLDVSRK